MLRFWDFAVDDWPLIDLKVCRNCCSGFDNSNELAKDIFQNTFLKVYNKAYTFKLKNEEKTNISADIKAWLSRIAKNELINFLRKNPDEKLLSNPHRVKTDDLEEKRIENSNEMDDESILKAPSIQKEILDRALGSLSPDERHVLLTYMQYYDPGFPNRHLPEDVLANLCRALNVKSGSIRQIKLRALNKIKAIRDNHFKWIILLWRITHREIIM